MLCDCDDVFRASAKEVNASAMPLIGALGQAVGLLQGTSFSLF
jgi:hypothetical protein